MTAARPDCHAVVFDVNVWLDVAEIVGEPFSGSEFATIAAAHVASPLPFFPDHRVDSVRAVATCESGRFAGTVPVQVWTSEHIDHLVTLKLTQPRVADRPERRGLGWSSAAAGTFLTDFVYRVVDDTGGDTVGPVVSDYGCPPLDHEDGLVYRTADLAGDDDGEHCIVRSCITRDRAFRTAPGLPGLIERYYPHEWVQLVRASRRRVSLDHLLSAPRPQTGT